MSEEGEKTCPLCAEEMDLTDQQLKPCKCGYEICVWCWHHIMDMAEKDETEGRCPACRTPYNKEKIVGTAANCERLVSEMNVEKKKSHKGKSKTFEGRKHLASVRVIQRNLVYVVGLPLNFSDEDLLQRKEYFGQYGKVLKVSISRTATGAIQHFANSTCSVYITFSKEEEAVRCIQSVHGFVLDGRPLKACFGTTKYCHAWLRNVPCSNPECLYLHEIGSHEDSFTKDEIISAYTRSRVQQITGSSNSTQRRSGNVLPPPVDENCNNNASSGKPITKTAVNTNSSAVNARISPPNSSSGRSVALPAGASWGSRASNNQPLLGSRQCTNVLAKQKSDVCNGPVGCSTAAASPAQLSSLRSDTGKMLEPDEGGTISKNKSKNETLETENLDPGRKESDPQRRISFSESSITSVHSATLPINRQPHNPPSTKPPPNSVNIVKSSLPSNGAASDKDSGDATDVNIKNICSDILSMGIQENQIQDNGSGQRIRETVTSQMTGTAVNTSTAADFLDVQPDIRLGMPTQVTQVDLPEIEDDLLSFEKQRLKDPEVASIRMPDFSQMSHLSKHCNINSSQFSNADSSIGVDLDRQVVDRNGNLMNSTSNISSGYAEAILKIPEVNDVEYSNLFPSKEKGLFLGRYDGEVASGASDIGESSIITNILSMDFDTWDEPLTSSQNLAKLLGDTDKRQGSLGLPGSLKIQNNNQSRFSFAREEESMSQVSNCGNSVDYFEKGYKQHSLGFDISNKSGLQLEKILNFNSFPVTNGFQSDSRSQISAPPGFSMPSRAPPPGFNSHERTLQNLETLSGNPTLDVSSMLRNHYQAPSGGCSSIRNDEIEFIDPAILAVGKGMVPGGMNSPGADLRSSYSQQLNTYEEARFQSFLQSSLPSRHDQGRTNLGNGYSSLGDAYGIPSRVMEQTLTNNLSPFSQFTLPQSRNGITSNGQWDGWNEIQSGNNLGMADLLRTERLGFSKFYGGFEDSKIQLPGSGNLYNRTYGI